MKVRLSKKAIEDGVLRVWVDRIPEQGGIVYAFTEESLKLNKPIGFASLYGRGPGSSAKQRSMLYFILEPDLLNKELQVDSELILKLSGSEEGEYLDIELNVIEVE